MADQEEEDLRMALRMSMQNSPPEPKRSKPRETAAAPEVVSPEDSRRLQREVMAAAAEKRILAAKIASPSKPTDTHGSPNKIADFSKKQRELGAQERNLGLKLSSDEANQLFSMVFGSGVSKDILAQWSNQGIRFSPDPETSMGLVQHEGGPCGVLATIQAFVLKYLLFFPEELDEGKTNVPQKLATGRLSMGHYVASDDFVSLPEGVKARYFFRL
uniref:Uncharacterized protein MANES_18G091200 n=1 Tax=Rhizophora mucronata TaxID=61149 RepID=A0A2P2JQM8_RHIMU